MKKVVLVLFAFLFFSVGQAFAYRVTDFSTDAKIVAAMRVLEQAGENDVFRNLQRYGMRIKFDDLSMVMNGKNAYAVSTYNNFWYTCNFNQFSIQKCTGRTDCMSNCT